MNKLVTAEITNDAQSDKSDFELLVSIKTAPGQPLSVSEYIERNSDKIRSIYLQWVFEMGEQQVYDEKPLNEILNAQRGINLWQMSLIAEKSIWKTPEIRNALQIIGLHELLSTHQVTSVILDDDSETLAQMVHQICNILHCSFRLNSLNEINFTYHEPATTKPISATIALVKYGIRRIPYVFFRQRLKLRHFNPEYIFVSYFDNFKINTKDSLRPLWSNYWGPLVTEVLSPTDKTLWIEIPPNSDSFEASFREALTVRKINKLVKPNEKHVLLHSFLTIRIMFKAYKLYRNQLRIASHVTGAIDLPTSQGLILSPIMRDAWLDSIIGSTALRNILWALLFQSALTNKSESSTCLYLQENQAWEVALNNLWHSRKSGKIIGFPHATVRYWDLRYFFDPKSFNTRKSRFPFPDISIANGEYAMSQLINGGVKSQLIQKAEALRYLNSSTPSRHHAARTEPTRILIMGEYDKPQMDQFADWISVQSILEKTKYEVLVKPHPNLPLFKRQFQPIEVEITNEPLSDLLERVDLVLAGAATSGAVEAYLKGKPLIAVTPINSINLGPLRGININTITYKESLSKSLFASAQMDAELYTSDDYFYLDSKLTGWKSLLIAKVEHEK